MYDSPLFGAPTSGAPKSTGGRAGDEAPSRAEFQELQDAFRALHTSFQAMQSRLADLDREVQLLRAERESRTLKPAVPSRVGPVSVPHPSSPAQCVGNPFDDNNVHFYMPCVDCHNFGPVRVSYSLTLRAHMPDGRVCEILLNFLSIQFMETNRNQLALIPKSATSVDLSLSEFGTSKPTLFDANLGSHSLGRKEDVEVTKHYRNLKVEYKLVMSTPLHNPLPVPLSSEVLFEMQLESVGGGPYWVHVGSEQAPSAWTEHKRPNSDGSIRFSLTSVAHLASLLSLEGDHVMIFVLKSGILLYDVVFKHPIPVQSLLSTEPKRATFGKNSALVITTTVHLR